MTPRPCYCDRCIARSLGAFWCVLLGALALGAMLWALPPGGALDAARAADAVRRPR